MRDEKGNSLILFPENYVVLDVETTGLSPLFDSMIELSAIRVRENDIVAEFSQIVKPYEGIQIDEFITAKTGITQSMVDEAPDLKDVIDDYISFISDDVIIGHNINFDISFLYDASELILGKPFCNDYIDTLRISRKLFPKDSHHRLCDLSEKLDIDYSRAHRALPDCIITKEVFDKMKEIVDSTIGEEAFVSSFCKRKRRNNKYEHLDPDLIEPDEESPLYKKTCVITGTLERFTRTEALRAIEKIGGYIGQTVTQKTNYLILGNNEYCATIKDGKSTKQKKAEEYILKGLDIEIIPEAVFYEMLRGDDCV